MMNDKEIAFIICVNNEQYFEEACFYINRLHVPAGYHTDIISIREADSMCAAYNAAMESSMAKYKVYLHQDVFIRNEDFLFEILQIFENEKIGMIGVMGGTCLPKNGVAFRSWNVGYLDCRDADMAYFMQGSRAQQEDRVVEAIDGLMMITQYDIPWREDLFEDFDFYDVSQSLEMRRAGYDVFVPKQRLPWVIHDSSFAKLKNYDKNRQICLREYPEFFYGEYGLGFVYDRNWDVQCDSMVKSLIACIEKRDWLLVESKVNEYRAMQRKDSLMESCCILYDIRCAEEKAGTDMFFQGLETFQEMYGKYIQIRFLLRRMELGMEEETYAAMVTGMQEGWVSFDALLVIVIHSVVEKKKVLQKLRDIYRAEGKQILKLDILLERIPDNIPLTYSQGAGMDKTI